MNKNGRENLAAVNNANVAAGAQKAPQGLQALRGERQLRL